MTQPNRQPDTPRAIADQPRRARDYRAMDLHRLIEYTRP
jgi:hypothetical protein